MTAVRGYFPAFHLVIAILLCAGGALPTAASAQINQAFQKNEGSWLYRTDTPSTIQSVFTIECWVKAYSSFVIVSRDRALSYPGDWSIYYDFARQRIWFMTQVASMADEYYYAPDNCLNAGQWNHIAVVVNGPGGRVRMYINGTLRRDASFPPRHFDGTTVLAWGGQFLTSWQATGSGLVDEARYWSLERTQEEIQDAMDLHLACGDRFGLVGYWQFCGNYADSSGHGNDMVPMNGANIVDAPELPFGIRCDVYNPGRPRIAGGPLMFESNPCPHDPRRDSILWIRNAGTADLVISRAVITGPQAGSFTLSDPAFIPPNVVIAPHDSIPFTLNFHPSAPGYYSAALELTCNDSAHLVKSIPLGGREDATVTIFPGPGLDFGTVPPNRPPQTRTISIRNEGSVQAAISATEFTPGAGYAILTPLPLTVGAGKTASITIQFDGKREGVYRSLLHLLRTPCDTTAEFVVTSIVAGPILFGHLLCADKPNQDTVTLVRNFSDTPLILHSASVSGGSSGDFSLLAPAIPPETVVAPGDSLLLSLRFAPVGEGMKNATLEIEFSNPETGVISIPLAGLKDRITLLPLPDNLDFGLLSGAQLPTEGILLIRNSGTWPATITGAILLPPVPFAVADTFPVVIQPGSAETLHIRFAPDKNGRFESSLRLSTQPCGDTLIVLLAGERDESPRIAVSPLRFAPLLCPAEVESDTLLLIRNTGNAPLVISAARMAGPDSADFTLRSPAAVPPAITIPPGDSTGFRVRFAPRSGGGKSAVLILSTNLAGAPDVPILLSGVKEITDVSAAPSPLDFGLNTPSSLPRTMPLIIVNSGTIDRTIISVTLEPPGGFTLLTPLPLVVSAGSPQTLQIRFDPPADGAYRAEARILLSPCDTILSIPVRGARGIAASIACSSPIFAPMRCASPDTAEAVIQIRNEGDIDLVLRSASIEGMDSSSFTLLDPIPPDRRIAPAESTLLRVRFGATGAGSYSALLRIASNAGNAPDLLLPLAARRDLIRFTAVEREIDLGVLCPSEGRDTGFVVRNTGTARAQALFDSDPSIANLPGSVTLDSAAQATVAFVFPGLAAEGLYSGTIHIRDECGNADSISVRARIARPRLAMGALTLPGSGMAPVEGDVPMTNLGGRLMRITRLFPDDPRFQVIAPVPPVLLDTGASLNVRIRYTPADTAGAATLLHAQYEPCGGDQQVALIVTASAGPRLAVRSVSHGTLTCESLRDTTITLFNIGMDTLRISALRIGGADGGDFAMILPPAIPPAQILPPGDSLALRVRFRPALPGSKSALLVLTMNTLPDSLATLPLSGTKEDSRVTAEAAILDFGAICGGERRDTTIRLRNEGSISQRISLDVSSPFSLPRRNLLLAPGSSDTITIRLIGMGAEGTLQGSLFIRDTCGAGGRVELRARAVAPRLEPGAATFRTFPGDTATQIVRVRNAGGDAIRILSAGCADSRFALVAPSLPVDISSGADIPFVIRYSSPIVDSIAVSLLLAGEPCNLGGTIPLLGITEEARATISLPDMAASVDTTVAIPVSMESSHLLAAGGAGACRFRLSFNRTLLLPIGIRPALPGAAARIVSDTLTDDERIVTVEASGLAAAAPGPLLYLDCMTGLGNALSTPLRFLFFDWEKSGIRTTTLDGSFRSTGICTEGGPRLLSIPLNAILRQNYPNPAGPATTIIPFSVEAPGGEGMHVRLAITDLLGREVAAVADGIFRGGEYHLPCDVSTLPRGMYIISMRAGSIRLRRSMMILR